MPCIRLHNVAQRVVWINCRRQVDGSRYINELKFLESIMNLYTIINHINIHTRADIRCKKVYANG